MEDPSFLRPTAGDGDARNTVQPTDAKALEPDHPEGGFNPLACPRCKRALEYVGTKRFHEGANWGMLGEIGELFVKREHFDVYVCPRCGRVEFFVDGIGEEYRTGSSER